MRIRAIVLATAICITNPQSLYAYEVPLPPGKDYSVPKGLESTRYAINISSLATVTGQNERITNGPGDSYYSVGSKSNEVYLNTISNGDIKQDFIGRLVDPELFAEYNSNSEYLVRFIYATPKYFYASFVKYNETARQYRLHVVRADLMNKKEFKTIEIFRSEPDSSGTNAWGGAMVVEDNKLYLSVGENRVNTLNSNWNFRNYSKNELTQKNTFFGKILEFTDYGRSKPTIYSLGHRNPYGLLFSGPTNQRIFWQTEIGPEGGDELNMLQKGKNYGWPFVSYGKTYDDKNPQRISGVLKSGTHSGYTQPVYSWVPSVSPTSIIEGNSSKEFFDWKGNLLVGTLSGSLERLTVLGKNVISVERIYLGTRLRNCLQILNGKIICSTDDAKILVLSRGI